MAMDVIACGFQAMILLRERGSCKSNDGASSFDLLPPVKTEKKNDGVRSTKHYHCDLCLTLTA